MTTDRPDFVHAEAQWELETVRFNGVPITLYRTVGDPRRIKGWVENPRVRMIIDRWRRRGHRASNVFPSDEEFLELMLEDDTLSRAKTFTVEKTW